MRSAGLFGVVSSDFPGDDPTSPRQLALRDFQLVDGTLAALAESAGMRVDALDTSGAITGLPNPRTHDGDARLEVPAHPREGLASAITNSGIKDPR